LCLQRGSDMADRVTLDELYIIPELTNPPNDTISLLDG